ncbi:MAG: ACP S-malonyltransferase [Phycisphaeraceae bacterium]|nr:ACP S-malonyltransferase [Phycisphaeraceae bacterium]
MTNPGPSNTSRSRIVLCPGQGAQAVGMGRAWAGASTEARTVFEKADRLLGDRLGGERLSTLCFEGPADRLNRTDVSQPAIYVAGVACWRGLLAKWGSGGGTNGVGGGGAIESHVVATAGLSLGEYTALHIAGVFSFEDGLELVALRGRAMQDAADQIRQPDGSAGSGMVAIIGADEAQVNELCDRSRGGEVLVPANFNSPGQIVVSGSIGACGRAVEVAGSMGLRATALPVAGAFHSPLMSPAADRLGEKLESTPMSAPRVDVMSNVTGEAHDRSGDASAVVGMIRRRLVEQLTKPVRWEQNCRGLVGRAGGADFVELAPGRTLAGLMRRIDKATKVLAYDEPESTHA